MPLFQRLWIILHQTFYRIERGSFGSKKSQDVRIYQALSLSSLVIQIGTVNMANAS